MDFQEIYETPMKACHHPDLTGVDANLLIEVKKNINQRYENILSLLGHRDPIFGRGHSTLTTVAAYTTGTVEVDGTTTITGTDTVWTEAMEGRKFKLDSFPEVYTLDTYGSGTSFTLNKACNEDAGDELSYVIYQDEIDLPDDCVEVVSIGQWRGPEHVDKIGINKMRELQLSSPYSVDPILIQDPRYWCYKDKDTIIVYPAPSRVIILPIDYTKDLTRLTEDEHEPIFPTNFHDVLIIGAKAFIYDYDDDTRADREEAMFVQRRAELIRKAALDTDPLEIKPYFKRTAV